MSHHEPERIEASVREKNLWVELLVNGLVAVYYFPGLFLLLQVGDRALRGESMTDLITHTVMVAVFASIALEIFLHARQRPEPMDERDLHIDGRGSAWASRVLMFCNGTVIGLILLQESGRSIAMLQLSPLGIANLLLGSFLLASISSTLVKVLLYRRGF